MSPMKHMQDTVVSIVSRVSGVNSIINGTTLSATSISALNY